MGGTAPAPVPNPATKQTSEAAVAAIIAIAATKTFILLISLWYRTIVAVANRHP
jgi:hypothetical protein